MAFQSSHTDNQRYIHFCQIGPWRVSSDNHSLASQRSQADAHTAGRWPSLLLHTHIKVIYTHREANNQHIHTKGRQFDQHMLYKNKSFFFFFKFGGGSISICVYTNLENSHRAPLLAYLSLCPLFSDNVLSECQPNRGREGMKITQNK